MWLRNVLVRFRRGAQSKDLPGSGTDKDDADLDDHFRLISPGFYDMLQSFDYTFILAGCSLIFSAVLCIPLRPILRWEKRRRGEPVPPTNGGGCFTRLLRRIRDHFR
ncbi:unnamed protein product, partial [Dibothriocephalus latus]